MKKILMFGIISISLLSQQKTVNYNNTWGNDLQNKILSMQKQGWEVQSYINLVGYQGSSEGCLVTYEKKSKITSTVIVKYKDVPSKITEITKNGWDYVDKIQSPYNQEQFILIFKKEN